MLMEQMKCTLCGEEIPPQSKALRNHIYGLAVCVKCSRKIHHEITEQDFFEQLEGVMSSNIQGRAPISTGWKIVRNPGSGRAYNLLAMRVNCGETLRIGWIYNALDERFGDTACNLSRLSEKIHERYVQQSASVQQEMLVLVRDHTIEDLLNDFDPQWRDYLPKIPTREEHLAMSLDELTLSVRSWNCLCRAGVTQVSQLVEMTESQLRSMRNMSEKGIAEVKKTLASMNLELAKEALE